MIYMVVFFGTVFAYVTHGIYLCTTVGCIPTSYAYIRYSLKLKYDVAGWAVGAIDW